MIVFKLILADMGRSEWGEVEITNKFSRNMSMGFQWTANDGQISKWDLLIYLCRRTKGISQNTKALISQRKVRLLYSHMGKKM